jgi:GGDEF domain-containing protein
MRAMAAATQPSAPASASPGLRSDERLVAADAAEALARLEHTELVERGSVVLLGLDAVRDRLGDRWERKRDQVLEHVDRLVERKLKPHDLFLRVGDAEYLLALPDEDRAGAHAVGLRLLREILTFFLGAAHHRDLKLHSVTDLSGPSVGFRPFTGEETAHAERAASAPAAHEHLRDPSEAWRYVETPLGGGASASLGLRCQLVRALHNDMVTAQRVDVQLFDSFDGAPLSLRTQIDLDPAAHLRIDLAALHHVHARQMEMVGQGVRLLGLAPLSIRTLTNLRTRIEYLQAVKDLPGAGGPAALLLEVVHLEHGTPQGRLLESATVLRPFCKGVVMRAPPDRAVIASLRGVPLVGVSAAPWCWAGSPMKTQGELKLIGEAVRGLAPLTFAFNLLDDPEVAAARAAGFTHYGRVAAEPPA